MLEDLVAVVEMEEQQSLHYPDGAKTLTMRVGNRGNGGTSGGSVMLLVRGGSSVCSRWWYVVVVLETSGWSGGGGGGGGASAVYDSEIDGYTIIAGGGGGGGGGSHEPWSTRRSMTATKFHSASTFISETAWYGSGGDNTWW